MSQNVLKILGFDEQTHNPVRVEMTLITKETAAEEHPVAFSAPSAFIPDSCRHTRSRRTTPVARAARRAFLPEEE